MKILFVTSTRIGDAVLSSGLLAHLVARHPGARIAVACGALPAPLFAAVPGLERIIAVTKRPLALHWLHLWAQCAATVWDLVVDLRGSGLAWTLAARDRRVLRPDRARIHRVERLARLFDLEVPPAPRLWLDPAGETEAARLIPAGGPVLALGPTANWRPKVWPAARFVALAERITAPDGLLPGARIAIFGGPGEEAMARPVAAALPAARRIDLVGRVDIATAAACLGRCALYVGNDSGLTHIAAAAGTPTLALFGPSPAVHYAPWGPNAAVAQTEVPYEALVGAPDFDHRAADNLMGSLGVEAAEAALLALWRRCAGRAA